MRTAYKLDEDFKNFISNWGVEPNEISTHSSTLKMLVKEIEKKIERKFPEDENFLFRGIPIKINDNIPLGIFHLIKK